MRCYFNEQNKSGKLNSGSSKKSSTLTPGPKPKLDLSTEQLRAYGNQGLMRLSKASTHSNGAGESRQYNADANTNRVEINQDQRLINKVKNEGASGLALGRQIALHPDIKNLNSPGAKKVLNHEMTHVVQWLQGRSNDSRQQEQQAVNNESRANSDPEATGVNYQNFIRPSSNISLARYRQPEIISFKLNISENRIYIDFDDDTQIIGRVSSHNLKPGSHKVRYDTDEKLLIFDNLDSKEIVLNYSIDDKSDRKKHRRALKKLTSEVPMDIIGQSFGNLTVPEDPFSVDDTGLLDNDSDSGNSEAEADSFDPGKIKILTAGELTLPDWVPFWAQNEIKTDTYTQLQAYKVRDGKHADKGDGVYIIPASEVNDPPWGDVMIHIDHPGGGYWRVQLFHEFPDDREYYERAFPDNEFKEQLHYDVFTGINKDIRYMVLEKGYSITGAREELRKINSEILKLTFEGVLALFTSAFGMGSVSVSSKSVTSGSATKSGSRGSASTNKSNFPPVKKPNKPKGKFGKAVEKVKKAGEKISNKLPGHKDWAKLNQQLAKEEAELAGPAGIRLFNTQKPREGYMLVRTIEPPAESRTYRHTLTFTSEAQIGTQLKSIEEDGLRVSTGGSSAVYGDGVYLWKNTADFKSKYYIDVEIPKEAGVERLFIYNPKGEFVGEWYRALPTQGDHLKVKIIGDNIPENIKSFILP